MIVTATERAVSHIASALNKRGHGVGVRLGVRTSGCSGMAYTLEFVDYDTDITVNDEVFKFDDVLVVIDLKSLAYLDGSEIDYVKEGLNEGFKFNNPQVTGECGCGESFYI